MLKYLLILLLPFSFLFAQNRERMKPIPENKCKLGLNQNIRYNMTYLQASGLLIDSDIFIPMAGIGFRTHKNAHGFDGSLNFFHYRVCSCAAFIPVIKLSYLHYPRYNKDHFFYWGIGAYAFPLPLPIASVGCEFNPKNKVKFFIQLDFTYKMSGLNLGIGF
jgi:hypothetical protein